MSHSNSRENEYLAEYSNTTSSYDSEGAHTSPNNVNNRHREHSMSEMSSKEHLHNNGIQVHPASTSSSNMLRNRSVSTGSTIQTFKSVSNSSTVITEGGEEFAKLYLKSAGVFKRSWSDYVSYHGIQRIFLFFSLVGLICVAIAAGLNARPYIACELQVSYEFDGSQVCCKCICDVAPSLCGWFTTAEYEGYDYQLLPRAPMGPMNTPPLVHFWNNVITNSSALFGILVSMLQVIFAFTTQNFYQILGAWLIITNVQVSFLTRQVSLGVAGTGDSSLLSYQDAAIGATWASTACGIVCLFLLKPLDATFGEVRFEHGAFGSKKRVVLRSYQKWFAYTMLDLQISICFLSCVLLTGMGTHVAGVSMWIACELASTPLLVFFMRRECKFPVLCISVMRVLLMVAWIFEIINLNSCLHTLIESAGDMFRLYSETNSYLFPNSHSAAEALLNVCPSIIGIIVDDKLEMMQFAMGFTACCARGASLWKTGRFLKVMFDNPGKVLDLFFDVPKQAAPKVRLVDETTQEH